MMINLNLTVPGSRAQLDPNLLMVGIGQLPTEWTRSTLWRWRSI
jgi:hypothetical protein